ncbi:hypothetical protein [Streptobacillus canis]|uniref:hypothetical protein n=1 Tax=Streptobacillus canis TaxID=2678686 RepID=UPI0012E217F8|nr:hypothetical protein [Streptobacillus canis]
MGHWEIDSVVGLRESSEKSIMILSERKTRVNIVFLLSSKTNENIIKSITSDNGTKFSNVMKITNLGVD